MEKEKMKTVFAHIQAGDPMGFEMLYHDYFRTMYGIAFSVLKEEDACYDAVQNVMIKLYTMDTALLPKDHEMTWLYTVTKNEALMLLRKKTPTVPLESVPEFPHQDQDIHNLVDMDYFYSVIRPLNEKQQKIVTMKVLGDMTHKEIAEVLSLPVGTVQWNYNIAIKQLRRILTSVSVFTVISCIGIVYELLGLSAENPPEGMVGIESIPSEPGTPIWLCIWIAFFILSIIVWIIFFKFSDKLPTKHRSSRI